MKDPSRVRVCGPLAPFADGFRLLLARQGYGRDSAAQRMQLVACLSRWMAVEGVSAAELSPELVELFVEFRRAAGYRHFRSPRGLAPLLAYLRALGVARDPVAPPVDGLIDMLVERYRSYLLGERGLAAGTVRYYERVARSFLSEVSAPGGGLDLARLTAGEVGRFVLKECSARNVGSAKNVVMALRSLLRFLHVDGVTGDLAGAVPAVAPQARSLPRALVPGTVERLLASCDRRTATGRRDFAVLIVLARLGLRAGEVAAIELQDIDWRRGELLVRGKGGRRERLPLPVDVGEALASYLQRSRPRVRCESLFMRVNAPTGGLSGDG